MTEPTTTADRDVASDIADAAPRRPTDPPGRLTVFYDADCALCRRTARWLASEPTRMPLRLLPTFDERAQALRPEVPWLGAELVVVGDHGGVWIGPAAFLMCLWATERYHPWATRLSGPAFAPLAERFFEQVSKHRGRIGARLEGRDPQPDRCVDGSCRSPHTGGRRFR
jgi:predicted DCC family thiol-disulfide oxidoreductase YuxK